MAPAAIILSGGPASVNAEDAPRVDPAIYELGVPILGFCYGHQVMAVTLGGSVGHTEVGEYGPAELHVSRRAGAVRRHARRSNRVDEPPRCREADVPAGFTVVASTDVCPVAAMECPERQACYATQFHPEVQAHRVRQPDAARTSCSTSAALSRTGPWTTMVEDSVDRRLPREGRRRPRHLGPFGRRRLLRGCRAGRTRHRQAADLRVRQPRLAAQGRARAGGGRVHQAVRRGLHPRARRGALRRSCCDGVTEPGAEAPHHRHAVLEGVLRRGGGPGRGRAPGEVSGPGHHLPRHHRERRAQDRRQGDHHQDATTT